MDAKSTKARQKRDAAIEQFNAAVESIQSSEQFTAYLQTRAKFHNYSLHNSVLIWFQRPDATHVAGYRAWANKFERHVKKGEKAITILAPLMLIPRPEDDDYALGSNGKPIRRMRGFTTASVFDVSQTEGKPLPEPVLPAPITGDSHAEYWPQLLAFASELGFRVELKDCGRAHGYCRSSDQLIAIADHLSVNAQVATLIHELIHAMGVSYQTFTRRQAETIAEGAAYIVATGLGLDTRDSSVPYVASWSTPGDREYAFAFIDYYAARVELALGLRDRAPKRPTHPDDRKRHTSAPTSIQEAA